MQTSSGFRVDFILRHSSLRHQSKPAYYYYYTKTDLYVIRVCRRLLNCVIGNSKLINRKAYVHNVSERSVESEAQG